MPNIFELLFNKLTPDLSQYYGEDVSQETFTRFLEKKPSPDKLEHWLKHVAKNIYTDQARAAEKRYTPNNFSDIYPYIIEQKKDPMNVEQEYEQLELHRYLTNYLQTLPENKQQIIALWANGIPGEEIAQQLGMTHNAVRIAIHKIVKQAKKDFKY